MNGDLIRYAFWGITTTPPRFACLDDFAAWTIDLGMDAVGCSEVWSMAAAFGPAIGMKAAA
jgi:hypothetical protein